jgi:flagellar hook-basal body complex protein FliE
MSDPNALSGMISPVARVGVPASPAVTATEKGEGKDFRSVLLDSLDEVNRLQTEADQGVQKLLTGEADNVAEVMAAVNKAGIAFDLLMEVRNKLVESYHEIQQMRI